MARADIVGLVSEEMGVIFPAVMGNIHIEGLAFTAVRRLSPTVKMGVIWRHVDPAAALQAWLELARRISP